MRQQAKASGTNLEIHPALAQDLTGLGNTLQSDMILHAQLGDQTFTLCTVPLVLPLVAIHKQLVICIAPSLMSGYLVTQNGETVSQAILVGTGLPIMYACMCKYHVKLQP